MPNPLFNMFGNQQPMNRPNQNVGPFNNPMEMIQQFNQFRSGFQGDPRQTVQNLLQTGQMSQEQFNQLSQMAQTFRQLIGR